MHSIPLGPSEKNSFCAKVQKPHFGAFPEAQKGVLICAICLRKAAHWPNNKANPSGLSEKNSLLCRKSAILSIRWKKTPILGPSLRPQKAQKANWRSRLHAQSSQMHSIPLGPSEKKFLLWKSTKKARYVRSLGKKPHFGAFPEAQKGVLICAICLRKAAHWPNNNANPSGLSEKTVYCVESPRFCR